ncbi:MAG: TlpA family protein disulfide reductase [Acidimicrobiales bacterium]
MSGSSSASGASASPSRRFSPRAAVAGAAALLVLTGLLAAARGLAPSGDDGSAAGRGDAGATAGGLEVRGLDPPPRSAAGDYAPNHPFVRFSGETGTLEEYRGAPVVVNFWSTTCVPCLKEMPAFEQVHQELAGEVKMLGLNVFDQLGPAQKLAAETGVTYELARDTRGEMFSAFGGLGMPTTAVVDAEGRVREVHTGALTADGLRELIDKALAR